MDAPHETFTYAQRSHSSLVHSVGSGVHSVLKGFLSAKSSIDVSSYGKQGEEFQNNEKEHIACCKGNQRGVFTGVA